MALKIYHEFIRAAPAAEAMEFLFAELRDVMFCIKDRQGRYLCANKAFLLRVGIDKMKDLVGKNTREVFPHSLAINFEEQDLEVFRQGTSISNRLDVATNPDRSLGWYISDKVPVRGLKREIIAVASTTRDLRMKVDVDTEMALIVNFVNLMRERFAEPIRISTLAEEAGIPLRKLERRMRSIMSISPRQLLTRIRVEAAAERLRNSQDSLSEITYRFGFCDQPTFCRQFKNLTGMTASEYRRSFQS
ncbi:AraC family transcriptional regulator [Roseibacillus persicicus]|uniref:AraC family transcriptional regulator n=1 Tax=Roseibacillus persicicus TaxID=454148 RepID=A0A918TGU2_9BACT|nr:AraC family transcriptional regulator [Roseibacillus persicicus]MDQ8191106.1 AraC family transcriptional regulator [Roseibacillus persicicus]GHC47513.1 AraC family transcriptional regulator [Roseibacillus persicicus]